MNNSFIYLKSCKNAQIRAKINLSSHGDATTWFLEFMQVEKLKQIRA